jgi:hypothetical protein
VDDLEVASVMVGNCEGLDVAFIRVVFPGTLGVVSCTVPLGKLLTLKTSGLPDVDDVRGLGQSPRTIFVSLPKQLTATNIKLPSQVTFKQ